MPGFIDVGNMSDADVKRMGHTDELDSNDQLSGRSGRGRVRTGMASWPTADVFTAAVVADRFNGGEYVKTVSWVPAPTPENPYNLVRDTSRSLNKDIMLSVLNGSTQPTQDDRDRAELIRQHFQSLYLSVLAGKILKEFESTVMSLSNGDVITDRQLGWIASLPSVYARETARRSVDERLQSTVRKHLGKIGEKITRQVEVVRDVYSQQWECYFITAITEDNHGIFFSQKEPVPIGSKVTLSGKVKAHRDGFQTQLNYVKII